MVDEDPLIDPFAPKPKEGIDRRTFVKAAMTAAAVGAVGATTAGLVVPLSTAGGLKIKRFPYLGARRVDGPAPQGVPLIPIRANEKGEIEGIPLIDITAANAGQWSGFDKEKVGATPEKDQPDNRPERINFLEWYRYCGHDKSPAFEPTFTEDNVLRYFNNVAKVAKAAADLGTPVWYANKLKEPLRVEDFAGLPPNTGAPFRWRSETLEGNDIVTGIIIKVAEGAMRGEDAEAFMISSKGPTGPKDLVAFSSYCAHFCCVPGYKESKEAIAADWFDTMYCTCHNSVYDPLQIKKYKFPPNL